MSVLGSSWGCPGVVQARPGAILGPSSGRHLKSCRLQKAREVVPGTPFRKIFKIENMQNVKPLSTPGFWVQDGPRRLKAVQVSVLRSFWGCLGVALARPGVILVPSWGLPLKMYHLHRARDVVPRTPFLKVFGLEAMKNVKLS